MFICYCGPCFIFLRRPWFKTLSSVMLCSRGIWAAYRLTCFNRVEWDCVYITPGIRVGVISGVARFFLAPGAKNHNDSS